MYKCSFYFNFLILFYINPNSILICDGYYYPSTYRKKIFTSMHLVKYL